MKISTKGRYAIRLILDIAENDVNGSVSLKDVSKRQGISLKYLEQIVNMLGKSGLVRSRRGAQGGYALLKNPSEITAGDILRVTEGSLAPVACLETAENTCQRAVGCPTIKLWEGLSRVINEYLDSVTIADLLKQKSENAVDMCLFI